MNVSVDMNELLEFVKKNAAMRGYLKSIIKTAPINEPLKKDLQVVLDETDFEFKNISNERD